MALSAILETAIGLVLVYALLSLICSSLNEWISRMEHLRATMLRKDIERLLCQCLFKKVEAHLLIAGMKENERFPNYIPASTFATALIHVGYDYTPGQNGLPGTVKVREEWKGKAEELLEALWQHANNLGTLQTRIERWFELAMEHTSGRYKRRVQLYVLAISFVLTAAANLDTFAIVEQLYQAAVTKNVPKFTPGHSGLPALAGMFGIALTWAMTSLGAPFWFDMINKLVNLRQTGLPPDHDERERRQARMMAH